MLCINKVEALLFTGGTQGLQTSWGSPTSSLTLTPPCLQRRYRIAGSVLWTIVEVQHIDCDGVLQSTGHGHPSRPPSLLKVFQPWDISIISTGWIGDSIPPNIDMTASTLHVAPLHVCNAGFVVYDPRRGQQEETGKKHQRKAIVYPASGSP